MINAVTWGWNSFRGDYSSREAKESLEILLSQINLTHVIVAFGAVQETPFSTDIDFLSKWTPSINEIKEVIDEIHLKGKKVILKPVVNCKDGTWRAHINFFDTDVPCEPKWSEWFESYNKYILTIAKIAQEKNCDVFVIGCEMVQADRREVEWRALIKKVRSIYRGKISYNCDKYQENNVKWWDAVDIISSSGYYPINTWNENLKRIKSVVEFYNKPFIFMEVGCPSKAGNAQLPNKWDMECIPSEDEQNSFYVEMFSECLKEDFVRGFGIWDWPVNLYDLNDAKLNCDYSFYGKKAEKTIKKYFEKGEKNAKY